MSKKHACARMRPRMHTSTGISAQELGTPGGGATSPSCGQHPTAARPGFRRMHLAKGTYTLAACSLDHSMQLLNPPTAARRPQREDRRALPAEVPMHPPARTQVHNACAPRDLCVHLAARVMRAARGAANSAAVPLPDGPPSPCPAAPPLHSLAAFETSRQGLVQLSGAPPWLGLVQPLAVACRRSYTA